MSNSKQNTPPYREGVQAAQYLGRTEAHNPYLMGSDVPDPEKALCWRTGFIRMRRMMQRQIVSSMGLGRGLPLLMTSRPKETIWQLVEMAHNAPQIYISAMTTLALHGEKDWFDQMDWQDANNLRRYEWALMTGLGPKPPARREAGQPVPEELNEARWLQVIKTAERIAKRTLHPRPEVRNIAKTASELHDRHVDRHEREREELLQPRP